MVKTRDSTETRGKLLADTATSLIRPRLYGHRRRHLRSRRPHQGQLLSSLREQGRTASLRSSSSKRWPKRLFSSAPYQAKDDPRERIFGYVDLRIAMLTGEISQYTCLIGTTVQEVYLTHPALRATCDRMLSDHVAMLTRDLEAAKKLTRPTRSGNRQASAISYNACCKAASSSPKRNRTPKSRPQALADLRAYLATLLGQPQNRKRKDQRR